MDSCSLFSLEEIVEVTTTTLDDLKSFLSEKFETQEQKLSGKFKSQENKLQEALAQQKSHFKSLTDPIIEKQRSTDLELEILNEDLEAQRKETSENKKLINKVLNNNQEIIKAQQQMSNTLRNIQEKQSETTPDPHVTKQRTDLLASLKIENCVLTVK